MRVLVVVDMQNDFVDGALGTPEAQAIVPKVVKKIEEFDGVILHTLDTHYGDYLDTQEGKLLPVKHCLSETEGWEMHPLIEEAIRHKSRESGYVQSFLKGTFGSVDLPDGTTVLTDGLISHVFTTDSIYRGNSEMISLI